ncbi:family 10 glycosylhydrolase [bacterium]|nr:family 10 glycosylhydrolase [bacterium]
MKNFRQHVLWLLIAATGLSAQSDPVKYEFRGAWIATVFQIDWPSSLTNTDAQKAELTAMLDMLQTAGINAVVFQIRPACDALYQSDIEPWSVWLTGKQGQAPSPYYDPLAFAVEEAHKRGMELHAWFNPYRAKNGEYELADNHVMKLHPEWILDFTSGGAYAETGRHQQVVSEQKVLTDPVYLSKLLAGRIILNPGMAAVREYILGVYMDVVNRYDIDAVHMDDYFYPYEGISSEDIETYQTESRGFTNIHNWRRDNINILVKAIHDSIQAVKPHVKFGISPFGIWRNGVPYGIVGLDAYNVIYCDAIAWLREQSIDYLAPQLYWPFGGGQDYGKLLPWWGSQVGTFDRHLYPGQGAHRVSSWPADELPNQIRLNRENPVCQGSIFYSANHFYTNARGFVDSLKNDFFRYPALTPIMSWKDSIPPNPPLNVRFEHIPSLVTTGLVWNPPSPASDGETPARYAVYRFNHSSVAPEERDDPSNIIGVCGTPYYIPDNVDSAPGDINYYFVTAIDHNSNESGFSNGTSIGCSSIPVLSYPANGRNDVEPDVVLSWFYPENASFYHLQLSTDSLFTANMLVDEDALTDTAFTLASLTGQETYYWRVRSGNGKGWSDFSSIWKFKTGYPSKTVLLSPPHNATNTELTPVFIWQANPYADTYRLQIASSLEFLQTSIIMDTSGMADTTYTGIGLDQTRFHFWRVSAENSIGSSGWSDIFRFRTLTQSSVDSMRGEPRRFYLAPNYPNPFNGNTVIPFEIARDSRVVIRLYDISGREIATLIDRYLSPGQHSITLEGDGLTSGVYFVRLTAENQMFCRKLVLIR